MVDPLTVYARRLPDCSVDIFRDREATQHMGRFPAHYTPNKPREGDSHVTLSCGIRPFEWLPDLTQAEIDAEEAGEHDGHCTCNDCIHDHAARLDG
jgi:hypothetical protein